MISILKHRVNLPGLEQLFTSCILLSVIFLPDFKLTSGFSVRPEDLIVSLTFCYLLLYRAFFNTLFIKILGLMAIIMIASIGLNNRLLSVNSFELYNKIIKGSVCYTIVLLFLQNRANYISFTKGLTVCIITAVIVNLLQIFHIPFISDIYTIYSNQIQMDAFGKVVATSSLPRVTGLIGNPNNNSTFFLVITGFILDQLLVERKKSIHLLILILCVTIIILTQSRTMFAATLGLFFIVLVSTGNILMIIIIGGAYFFIQYFDIKYLSLIFNRDEFIQTNSYTGRISEWQSLLEMINRQPFMGYGGYKEYFYETQTYPESEYILGWFRYGAFYVLSYIYLCVHIFIRGAVTAWQKLPNGYFMLSTSLAMIIGSISNTPFNNPRLFVLFALVNAYFQAGFLYTVQYQDM